MLLPSSVALIPGSVVGAASVHWRGGRNDDYGEWQTVEGRSSKILQGSQRSSWYRGTCMAVMLVVRFWA